MGKQNATQQHLPNWEKHGSAAQPNSSKPTRDNPEGTHKSRIQGAYPNGQQQIKSGGATPAKTTKQIMLQNKAPTRQPKCIPQKQTGPNSIWILQAQAKEDPTINKHRANNSKHVGQRIAPDNGSNYGKTQTHHRRSN